jgi:hypothetical protein
MITRSLDTQVDRVISETRDPVPRRLSARTLNPMSAEESEQLRLLEWFQYCRVDNGKANLGIVQADRVQLQQVILNLIANAVEAMSGISEGSRELLISTRKAQLVQDSGPGLAPATLERLFEASIQPSQTVWVWIYRSAVLSSKRTVDSSGRARPSLEVPSLNSPRPPAQTLHRDCGTLHRDCGRGGFGSRADYLALGQPFWLEKGQVHLNGAKNRTAPSTPLT